jgi:F-type H+-transporting ATPase subunit a
MRVAQPRKWWRWGVNRWIVLLFIILGFFAARAYPPIRPHVQLPAETLSAAPLFTIPGVGPIFLTNSLVATLLADVLLLAIGFGVMRATRGGRLEIKGFSSAVEALLELLYNLAESTAGKWARHIFPWMATIVMLVLVANWMELIPGVDSIGFLHQAEGEGYVAQEIAPGVAAVVRQTPPEGQPAYGVIPFVRAAATDLNFTLALALISVTFTQFYGIRAGGLGYFGKFFNVKTLFNKPIFGAIDFGVGLLEIISEISKILSFTFRLFGNIFAGSVLLFVIGTLVPVFAQTPFLMLEFFVGLIQAIVFGLLTLVFMAQATAGHGHGEAAHAT